MRFDVLTTSNSLVNSNLWETFWFVHHTNRHNKCFFNLWSLEWNNLHKLNLHDYKKYKFMGCITCYSWKWSLSTNHVDNPTNLTGNPSYLCFQLLINSNLFRGNQGQLLDLIPNLTNCNSFIKTFQAIYGLSQKKVT